MRPSRGSECSKKRARAQRGVGLFPSGLFRAFQIRVNKLFAPARSARIARRYRALGGGASSSNFSGVCFGAAEGAHGKAVTAFEKAAQATGVAIAAGGADFFN